jgi:diaminopimelate epimerase
MPARALRRQRAGGGTRHRAQVWPLALAAPAPAQVEVVVVSMGNPHAVQLVDDVDQFPVAVVGPQVERHAFSATRERGLQVRTARRPLRVL